jgi:hypothetical protein
LRVECIELGHRKDAYVAQHSHDGNPPLRVTKPSAPSLPHTSQHAGVHARPLWFVPGNVSLPRHRRS